MKVETEAIALLNAIFAEALCKVAADPGDVVEYVKIRISELAPMERSGIVYLLQLTYDSGPMDDVVDILN